MRAYQIYRKDGESLRRVDSCKGPLEAMSLADDLKETLGWAYVVLSPESVKVYDTDNPS